MARHRFQSWALNIFFAVLLVVITGCGGAPPPAGNNELEPVPTIINPKVRVLDNYNVQVVDKTENSLTLTGDVPLLERDDVLVSGKGNGLLRKVVATRRSRSNATVVETVPATLEDVFEQADIHISGAFIPVDVALENLPEGVTVTPVRSPGRAELVDYEVKVDSKVLYGKEGGRSAIKGSARLRFSVRVDVDIRIRYYKVEYFRLIMSGSIKTELELIGDIAFWRDKIEKVLWRLTGAPLPTGIPWLVFIPELKGVMGVEGEVVAGLHLPLHAETTVTGGIEYSKGFLHPIARATITAWYPPDTPVQPFSELSLRVYKRPELSLKINDISGPFVAITMYLDGKWTYFLQKRRT